MKEKPNLDVGGVGWFDSIIWLDPLHDPLNLTESSPIEPLRSVQEGSQHDRQQHEMIILHPNHRTRLNVRQNNLCKLEIRRPVRPPVPFVKVHFAWVVMEQGPENRV